MICHISAKEHAVLLFVAFEAIGYILENILTAIIEILI
jgi:hypothetical protein